jgi:hypothetical protein
VLISLQRPYEDRQILKFLRKNALIKSFQISIFQLSLAPVFVSLFIQWETGIAAGNDHARLLYFTCGTCFWIVIDLFTLTSTSNLDQSRQDFPLPWIISLFTGASIKFITLDVISMIHQPKITEFLNLVQKLQNLSIYILPLLCYTLSDLIWTKLSLDGLGNGHFWSHFFAEMCFCFRNSFKSPKSCELFR